MHSPAHKAEFPNFIVFHGRKPPPSFFSGGDHARHNQGYLGMILPRSIKLPVNDRRSLNLQLTMDPMSFSASLVTLGGLVAATAKGIYKIQGKLRHGPQVIHALLERLHTFENLLIETNKQLQDHWGHAQPQELLQHVWGDSLAQMQRDIQSLHSALTKVKGSINQKSWRSKILSLARQLFDEEELALYQDQINAHCGTLTNMQALLSWCVLLLFFVKSVVRA